MNRIANAREQLLRLAQLQSTGAIGDARYLEEKALLERELIDAVLSSEHFRRAQTPWTLRVAALAAFVVLAAAFWWLGHRPTSGPGEAHTGAASSATSDDIHPDSAVSRRQMADMAEKLAERLGRQPDNAAGWAMLARSYALLDKPTESVQAYGRALALDPTNATWLAEQTQARALSNGGRFGVTEAAMVRKVLALEPENLKGLWLAGTMAFERHDYSAAIHHWEKMLQTGPIEDLDVTRLQASIAEARQRRQLGLAGGVTGSAHGPNAQTR